MEDTRPLGEMAPHAVVASPILIVCRPHFCHSYHGCFCCCVMLKRYQNELWADVSPVGGDRLCSAGFEGWQGVYGYKNENRHEFKMSLTVFGHRESWCLCGRGLSCFQHYKEDWNKAARILLFTSFNECSSHLGPFVWLSVCKGLAVENVHGITCSWGKHLPRICSPPNCF